MTELVPELAAVPVFSTLDGELIAFGPDGTPDFPTTRSSDVFAHATSGQLWKDPDHRKVVRGAVKGALASCSGERRPVPSRSSPGGVKIRNRD
jgi:hypothetical protein